MIRCRDKINVYCKLDLPQRDWTPHCHTVWKWSLIGHCTIWVHPKNCLHLSHWRPALKGQVQGGLDRGAGLHQPRRHTGEKENNKNGQKGSTSFFICKSDNEIFVPSLKTMEGSKSGHESNFFSKTCRCILDKINPHICATYKQLGFSNLLNLLLVYWSLTQHFLIVCKPATCFHPVQLLNTLSSHHHPLSTGTGAGVSTCCLLRFCFSPATFM